MTQDDMRPLSDDRTIPTRGAGRDRPRPETPVDSIPPESKPLPWLLETYFRAETDYNRELVARLPHMPVLSLINFRTVGEKTRLHIASLSTPDGSSSVLVDVDAGTKAVCFTYTFNSMLALRFQLGGLKDKDRAQWMLEMREERGEVAFLWDQRRWEHDYVIGVAFKNYTNLFAFSPTHVEAGARLTAEVARKLLDWLGGLWKAETSVDSTPSALPW